MADAHIISAHISNARPHALAALTRYFKSLDFAEDAFQDACLRALQNWPEKGIPRDPAAWLILTGRNAGLDILRSAHVRKTSPLSKGGQDIDVSAALNEAENIEDQYISNLDLATYRDDILRLLFLCCQDALSDREQLILALKIVVGLSVSEIARAFLIKPKAMEQRITRAKKKAQACATTLDTPSRQQRLERVNAVSTMIYLLFNEGYSAHSGEQHIKQNLCEEAIRLARLLLQLFPSQSEVMGLLALCLLHHARSPARIDNEGNLIPLDEQDRSLWQQDFIAEGRILVEKALRRGTPGPYQIQAAISAVHCAAQHAEETDWHEIERLYGALEIIRPSPIVSLNKAVALSKTQGAKKALEHLSLLAKDLDQYLHYHTARAALYQECARYDDAVEAYQRALGLNPTEAERVFIQEKIEKNQKSMPDLSE